MPTEPNAWLNRDSTDSGADKLIEVACPVLREVINKATLVFQDCHKAASGEADEDLPILMSTLHVVEMADGVEILLGSSSVHPAKLLLRSMLEGTMSIQYILKSDSKRRSFAWLVARAHRRLSAYEAMSPNTQAGKQLRGLLTKDELQLNLEAISDSELTAAIDNLRGLLKQDNYREGEAEYRRIKKKLKRNPEWFSLYDGPTSIRDLAGHLRQLSSYQFLYRTWSELTHAGDAGRWLTKTAAGGPAFFAIRSPQDLLQVANYAVTFLLTCIQAISARFTPQENFGPWYIDEVSIRYLRLTGIKLNVVGREIRDT